MKKISISILTLLFFSFFGCKESDEEKKSQIENNSAVEVVAEKKAFNTLMTEINSYRNKCKNEESEECVPILVYNPNNSNKESSELGELWFSIGTGIKWNENDPLVHRIDIDSEDFSACAKISFVLTQENIVVDGDCPEEKKKQCLKLMEKYGVR